MSKGKSALLVASLLLAGTAARGAGNPQESWIVRCGGPFQLCGLVERETGEERIGQRFEVAERFSDGLAAVRVDGRWGYIDPAGKVVIQPQFEAAGPFTGEFAEVRIDGKSGAIDHAGRIVVPAAFDRLLPLAGGTFIARPWTASATTIKREIQLHPLAYQFGLMEMGASGLYHVRRGWLTPADLNFDYFDVPERGLIWAGKRNEHNDVQWGLLRADGTWQVTPRFNHVQQLSETHAIVGSMPDYSLPPREQRDSMLRGAVDRDGKLVVPFARRGISYWRGGYGLSRDWSPGDGPKEGILKADGELLAGRYFDEVDVHHRGEVLPRGRIGKTWYSIEPDGRLVPDQLEGKAVVECPGGLTILRRGDGVEFRKPGQTGEGARFENGYFDARNCPGPFSARRNGKYLLVLEDGTVIGASAGFDDLYSSAGKHIAVKVDGKWGVIDRTGHFTVKPTYKLLSPAGPDVFAISGGKTRRFIDAHGKPAPKPAIKLPSPQERLTCPGGLRFFTADGLWGLQDGDGKTVIEPRYRALSCFVTGVTWTAAPDDECWRPVGPEGKQRDAIPCRKTFYPVRVTHHFPEKFNEDPYESSVLWVRASLDHLAGVRADGPKWISDEEGLASYSVMPAR